LTYAEDPEELVYVAEARLIMGKILVDIGEYREAITYLDKAKAAFEICGHYALGETLLYLGKAHQGLGGTVFLTQAREYVTSAIAEFQRLELFHKEKEAQEVLEKL
jgi:tetratricopeptide (TPR) repeat protein